MWSDLIQFVKSLPYGRNLNRTDLELVIIEKKGSCSSKHALLKKVADLNKIQNVKLILGIYKMNQQNTPGIGKVLLENDFEFIPEAHCYLEINNRRIDVTTNNSQFEKIEPYILTELEIRPEQIAKFKVEYHKTFLLNWITENRIDRSLNDIWNLREKCINNLSKMNGPHIMRPNHTRNET